jgi:hypothetical protein
MDNILDEVNRNLDQLNDQLKAAEGQIDQNTEKVKDLKEITTKLDGKFITANKRLKDTIKRFRAPSKLCMDVCLIILIIVLLGILVRQVIALTK